MLTTCPGRPRRRPASSLFAAALAAGFGLAPGLAQAVPEAIAGSAAEALARLKANAGGMAVSNAIAVLDGHAPLTPVP